MSATNDTQEPRLFATETERADWLRDRCAALTEALEQIASTDSAYAPGWKHWRELAREALGAAPAREELPGGDLGGPRPAGVRRCNHTYKHGPHDVYHDGIPWRCPGDVPTSSGGVTLTEEQAERVAVIKEQYDRYADDPGFDVDARYFRAHVGFLLALLRGEEPR